MTEKSRDELGGDAAPRGKDQGANPPPDLSELSQQMTDIAEKSRHLVTEFLKRQSP